MIRAATPDDVGQIAALVRASFDARLHDYMVYAQHGIDRFLAVQIAMPQTGPARFFLVDADPIGQVRAFAEFQRGDGVDFLSYICVARETRGTGLATALIDHHLADAPARSLQLDVFADNHAAIALYHKLGFKITGETGWFVRDLPAPGAASKVRMSNAVEASAMFAWYGFCRYGVAWQGEEMFAGRIGPRTLRCYRGIDFADDALLGALHRLFPEARRSIYICATDAADRPDPGFLFHRSLRLERHVLSCREH
jgi:ribosomal protein S18 acetylase RimI-like enzyme